MATLGIKAYRFSISWPRIDPNGDGQWNAAGLDYYRRVTDCCLLHGIQPYVTLYHWDLPYTLECAGGWGSRSTAYAFARYCGFVAAHFAGKIRHYITLNEIQCIVSLGYGSGIYAPGQRLSPADLFRCHHNLLLAHGLAFRAIRTVDPNACIGIASTGRLCYPSSPPHQNLAAARAATFATSDEDWMFTHQMVLDPICLGRYPNCPGTTLQPLIDAIPRDDMSIIHTDVHFLGFNIYNGTAVCADTSGDPVFLPKTIGCPRTALKWPITPDVMEFGPLFLWERYQKSILITENGLSCNDFIYLDGAVHDLDRIDFLTRYLLALQRVIGAGVPIIGYFHWAFTDNFEWNRGYSERFGLVYVDFNTQDRTCKDSALWYRSVIQSNGGSLSTVTKSP